MLAFLPWLRIPVPIRTGPFLAFPHGVGDVLLEGIEASVSPDTLKKVLSQYRLAMHLPLGVITVIQYDGRPLGDDLDEADRSAILQFGRHLAVSGLSDRRFTGGFLDAYTASGHYQVIIQAFTEPYRGSVNVTYRRKGGHVNVLNGQSDVHFVMPAHLVSQGTPNLNLPLLKALHAVPTLPENIREHVEASVTQFLLANGDSPDVPLEAESIATYAALERVTNSSQRLDDIQAKLPAILSVVEGSPWTGHLRTELECCVEDGQPMLHSWLQQIYALRGNVAHGKPAHWAPREWSQQEHLVAGAFVYPLVLKCLLSQNGLYPLTEEDVAHTLGLEGLIGDRPFYALRKNPDEPEHDLHARSGWVRQFNAVNEALLDLALSRTIRDAMDQLEGERIGVLRRP